MDYIFLRFLCLLFVSCDANFIIIIIVSIAHSFFLSLFDMFLTNTTFVLCFTAFVIIKINVIHFFEFFFCFELHS